MSRVLRDGLASRRVTTLNKCENERNGIPLHHSTRLVTRVQEGYELHLRWATREISTRTGTATERARGEHVVRI